MRILLISGMYPSENNPVFGVFVRRQVDALEALGHQVTTVVNQDPTPGTAAALKKYSALYRRAIAASRSEKFDVVVGHYLYPIAYIAQKAAAKAGVPYVLVTHGSDVLSLGRSDFLAKLSRKATAGANGIAVVGQQLAERLQNEVALSDKTIMLISHMGVDLNVFSPILDARGVLGWEENDKVAIQVANLAEVKGPDLALEACIPLLQQGALDKLVFVGDGVMRDALTQAVVDAGVSDKVLFTGRVTSDIVAQYMSAANVTLLASRNEGLGLVILESLACGTPVVAFAVGGVPEILPTPPCGYAVEAGNIAQFAASITEALAAGKDESQCTELVRGEGVDTRAREFEKLLIDCVG